MASSGGFGPILPLGSGLLEHSSRGDGRRRPRQGPPALRTSPAPCARGRTIPRHASPRLGQPARGTGQQIGRLDLRALRRASIDSSIARWSGRGLADALGKRVILRNPQRRAKCRSASDLTPRGREEEVPRRPRAIVRHTATERIRRDDPVVETIASVRAEAEPAVEGELVAHLGMAWSDSMTFAEDANPPPGTRPQPGRRAESGAKPSAMARRSLLGRRVARGRMRCGS